MRLIKPFKCLAILGFLSNAGSNVIAQVSSTPKRDATAEGSLIAIDPDGQKAWDKHGFTIEQRKNLRETFD